MSKVIILHAAAKDTWPVSTAVKATGWIPGQLGALSSTGETIKLAVTDETLFVLADDDSELASPPSGSVVTGIYGAGSKLIFDHSAEVAASSAVRCYESDVESAAINADLYVSSSSKWVAAATGSVKAKMFQKPTAANSYQLGVLLRF